MAERPEAVFSERIGGRNVSYLVEVRESAGGRVYLSLSQSRPNGDHTWDHQRITIFPELAKPVRKVLLDAIRTLDRKAGDNREVDLDELRKTLPRAFEKWTPAEDEALRAEAGRGTTVGDAAASLGRSRRSVEMRLQKLGLPVPGQP
jgi:hypothetical protein